MRDITQQAMASYILGGLNPGGSRMVSRSGLAFETSAAIRSLAKKHEESLFRADSSVYSMEFDGIRAQIMETDKGDRIGTTFSLRCLASSNSAIACE